MAEQNVKTYDPGIEQHSTIESLHFSRFSPFAAQHGKRDCSCSFFKTFLFKVVGNWANWAKSIIETTMYQTFETLLQRSDTLLLITNMAASSNLLHSYVRKCLVYNPSTNAILVILAKGVEVPTEWKHHQGRSPSIVSRAERCVTNNNPGHHPTETGSLPVEIGCLHYGQLPGIDLSLTLGQSWLRRHTAIWFSPRSSLRCSLSPANPPGIAVLAKINKNRSTWRRAKRKINRFPTFRAILSRSLKICFFPSLFSRHKLPVHCVCTAQLPDGSEWEKWVGANLPHADACLSIEDKRGLSGAGLANKLDDPGPGRRAWRNDTSRGLVARNARACQLRFTAGIPAGHRSIVCAPSSSLPHNQADRRDRSSADPWPADHLLSIRG